MGGGREAHARPGCGTARPPAPPLRACHASFARPCCSRLQQTQCLPMDPDITRPAQCISKAGYKCVRACVRCALFLLPLLHVQLLPCVLVAFGLGGKQAACAA